MRLDIVHGAVRRGRRTVLEPGRVTAPAPDAVAFVGINGSGKSSLFMQLSDTLFSSRTAAFITLDGRSASIAYAPQVPALPGWLPVEGVAQLYGLDFDMLLDTMPGLFLHELAGQRAVSLSVGQKQVLSIALALGRHADVTLLDEPFSALDFRRRIGAIQLLQQCRQEGRRAILLSSQSASDLIELCDRFVVIRDGRYIFSGTRAELNGSAGDRELERRLLQLLI